MLKQLVEQEQVFLKPRSEKKQKQIFSESRLFYAVELRNLSEQASTH